MTDTIPCRLCGSPATPLITRRMCGSPTTITTTELCDPCWELGRRIHASPALARRILEAVEHDQLRKAAPPLVLSPGGRRAEAEHSGLVLFLLGALLLVALLFWFRS